MQATDAKDPENVHAGTMQIAMHVNMQVTMQTTMR